jgi:hypothetical protein
MAGGVYTPVLLLWGFSGVSASVASLLLNFEGALTTILASLIFGEAVGKRVWWSVAIMLLAGSTLVYSPDAEIREFLPAAAVIAACLLWGLDNNLTRYISGANAATIAIYKDIAAGCVNLTLAALAGATLPSVRNTIAATLIGFFSYGLSLVLFIIALRHLGSTRTSAHFGTAPFFGIALSIILLNEPLTTGFAVGLMLMIFATSPVLTETHEHFHVHTPVTHEHPQRHDEHHDHAHSGQEGSEPHSHIHTHAPLAHSHPHLPDLHHRRRHKFHFRINRAPCQRRLSPNARTYRAIRRRSQYQLQFKTVAAF